MTAWLFPLYGITEQRIEEVYGIKSIIYWCEQNRCPYMIPLKGLVLHKQAFAKLFGLSNLYCN